MPVSRRKLGCMKAILLYNPSCNKEEAIISTAWKEEKPFVSNIILIAQFYIRYQTTYKTLPAGNTINETFIQEIHIRSLGYVQNSYHYKVLGEMTAIWSTRNKSGKLATPHARVDAQIEVTLKWVLLNPTQWIWNGEIQIVSWMNAIHRDWTSGSP